MRRIGMLAAATAMLGLSGLGTPTGNAAAEDKTRTKAADPLVTLNETFRQAYAAERAALLARGGPVIVVAFDSLALKRGGPDGAEETASFTPAIYHEAKAIAHIPLALYVWLQARVDRPLGADFLDRLGAYRARIVAAVDSLEGREGWTEEALATHRKLADASLALIDAARTSKQISADRLAAFARAMRPLVLASADLAASAQLDGLHALVARWRAKLGPAAWARTRFVVLTSRQARRDNLQFAYFLKLLGPKAVGRRLIIAESVWDAKGGRAQLGTVLLDRRASAAFFGDPARLERDLLGDAAGRWLARMPMAAKPAGAK